MDCFGLEGMEIELVDMVILYGAFGSGAIEVGAEFLFALTFMYLLTFGFLIHA